MSRQLPSWLALVVFSCSSVIPSAYALNKYQRSDWRHWSDLDHDCLNTRHELLQERSEAEVKHKPRDHCHVIRGRWTDPYTGKVWYRASDVDIDHIIPLKWAHEHGGAHWSKTQREAFANDPRNLLIVEDDLNHQKGASAPDTWLPPKNRCWYKQKWQSLLETYQLKGQHLDLSCTATDKATELASSSSPNPEDIQPPMDCDSTKSYCRHMTSCEEAVHYLKHCGLQSLDGDGDGIPCEALCR